MNNIDNRNSRTWADFGAKIGARVTGSGIFVASFLYPLAAELSTKPGKTYAADLVNAAASSTAQHGVTYGVLLGAPALTYHVLRTMVSGGGAKHPLIDDTKYPLTYIIASIVIPYVMVPSIPFAVFQAIAQIPDPGGQYIGQVIAATTGAVLFGSPLGRGIGKEIGEYFDRSRVEKRRSLHVRKSASAAYG